MIKLDLVPIVLISISLNPELNHYILLMLGRQMYATVLEYICYGGWHCDMLPDAVRQGTTGCWLVHVKQCVCGCIFPELPALLR